MKKKGAASKDSKSRPVSGKKPTSAMPAKVSVVKEPEPPKIKENFKLKALESQWQKFDLEKVIKENIESLFKQKRDPLTEQIKKGKRDLPPPNEHFDKVILKQKAKLLKQEYEEGLTHMRIKENMLSKKEFQERKQMLNLNLESMIGKEKDFQAKLGLSEHFMKKNSNLEITQLSLNNGIKPLPTSTSFLEPKTDRFIDRLQSKNLQRPKSSYEKTFKTEEEKTKHEEFVKKLKEEMKLREKIRKQYMKIKIEKVKKKEEKETVEKRKKDELKLQERKNKLLKLQEELEQKELERQELNQKQNEQVKYLMKQQPLFIKMETKFVQEVQLPLLEQKKKKLDEIRNFFKQPLDTKEINQHMRRYQSEAELRQVEREKKKNAMLRQIQYRDNEIKPAKVVELEERLKEEEDEKQQERLKIQEKMNNYFSYVKESILEEEFAKVKSAKNSVQRKKIREGLHASQSEKQHNQSTIKKSAARSNRLSIDREENDEDKKSYLARIRPNIVWKSDYSKKEENAKLISETQDQLRKKASESNYLRQLVDQRNSEIELLGKKKIDDTNWHRYLNDDKISDRERYELVRMRALQIEEKAKLDEKVIFLDNNDPNSIQKAIDVNDMYIESIQAKLKLLNAD